MTDQRARAAASPDVPVLHRSMPFTRLTDTGMDPADARRLLAATSDGRDWEATASAIATEQDHRSFDAERTGHAVTALEAARFATASFLFAQMARDRDDDLKRQGYDRYVSALARVARLTTPNIERVEMSHQAGRLVGWLCLPPGGHAAATVVVWGGLSSWGGAYLPIADALNRRGLASLLAEGPGQGESRMRYGCHLDEDVASGFARFIDFVAGDPRLGERVGVQGNSIGGLFAALTTAADPRIDACVINGAPSAPTLPDAPSARDQFFAALGTDDADRAARVLARIAFDGRSRGISRPMLVLHGGQDFLVAQQEQESFLDGASSATSELRVWPDGEHTLYNHANERNALTADWFADRLLPAHAEPREADSGQQVLTSANVNVDSHTHPL